jgi:hypothetical protein
MTAIAFCAADSHLPRDLPPGRAVHLMDFTFLARVRRLAPARNFDFNKFVAV